MLLRASLLTGAVVLAVAGCGGGDDKASPTTVAATTAAPTTTAATTTTERATTTTERATTTTAATSTTAAPSTTAGPVVTIGPGPLTAALLTAEDVGEGFVATRTGPDTDPDETTPCGTPPPSQTVGTGEQDSVDIANEEKGLLLTHTIEQYADEATAQQAMTLGKAGLACGSGSTTNSDGSTVKFELQEVEMPSPLGDESFAYQGTATVGDRTFGVIFIAARDGRAVTTIAFQSLSGNQGPAIEPILATAEQKLATVA